MTFVLPDDLREPLLAHLADLRAKYLARDWGHRVGFGQRPALIVIDMARYWLDPEVASTAADLESVLSATQQVLTLSRGAKIPIFFTTFAYDPNDPPSPQNRKLVWQIPTSADVGDLFEIDPRLAPLPGEKGGPQALCVGVQRDESA